jgi:arsenate reductase
VSAVPTGADATHKDENGSETRLYVNDECSKCHSALSILDERGVDAEHVRYLEQPPSVNDLVELMEMLGIDDPRAMMRTGESAYAELGLERASPDQLLDAVATHPILLERPIFVVGDKAVIARPPERLLELL